MSTLSKIGLGAVALVVVLIVGVYAMRLHSTEEARVDEASLPTQPSDASDDALAQDAAAIDAQLQGLSSDNAAADQSLQVQ